MAITLNGTTGITTPALDTSGDVTFADNDKAVFGAGSDLQIYHIADTGNLIQGQSTYGNIDIMSHSTRILDNGSNVMADFSTSGSSSRLFNGADGLKLATTATGIDVTGTVVADGLTVDKTATISTTDYYAASTFSSVLKGAATNTKAALLLNSVSSSGQNAFASIHSEPVADFRASLIGTYSADGSGAGYFAINQFLPSSSATQERLRIDSSGNVLVGAAAFSGSVQCLQVESNGTLDIGTNTTAGRYRIQFFNPNGFVGSIATNGSSVQFNTSSDYRLKQDWQLMSGASDRVLALKPVNFAWIVSGDRVDGFLAHELADVVPEAVTGTKDGMEDYEITPAVLDNDGNVTTEALMGTRPVMQGIDQSKLVPLLTAALQEALNKIEAMETRLAALEAV
jgi:hypothetical protein